MRLRSTLGAALGGAAGCDRPPEIGPLLFVREESGRNALMWSPAAALGAAPPPRALRVPGDQAFAAPAGPAGAPLLALSSTDGPDGHEERLWIVDPDGGARAVGPGYARLRSPAWAADGSAVVVEGAVTGFSDLVAVQLHDGEHRPLTALPTGAFTPAVAPDGTVAFVSGPDGDLDLYTVPMAGGPIRPLLRAPGEDLNPSWSPDGAQLAWISGRGGALGLSVLGRGGGEPRALWAPTGGAEAVPDQGIGWSPDGRHLALPVRVHERVCIAIFDVDSGAVLRGPGAARGCPAGVEQGLAWAPNGQGLITSRSSGGDADLVYVPLGSGEDQAVSSGPGVDWLPRWLSDGAPR